jgi:DNA polymerase elongation subunit (family B)
MNPKVLSVDIETAPSLGWYFDLWKEGNIVRKKADWYVLSWSAKLLGGKQITRGLIDYPLYKPGPDDRALLSELHALISDADIVVAHNGDKFDIKKINARFIYHGLKPPDPYKTVDTLRVAKRYFAFESNRLDSLGEFLGVGRKTKHPGFDMWEGCMYGDRKSWDLMLKYNKQDVLLLEDVYLKLLPWMQTHPHFKDGRIDCPNCNSTHLQSRGKGINKLGKYSRFQCQDCGAWSQHADTKKI